MATYAGRSITVTALPAVHVEGNPVTVVAPKAFYARFDAEGELQPARLGVVTESGIVWLSPPL